MERERVERSPWAGRLARLLAGAIAMTAAAGAWAGTDTGSFGVGLRITASCQVDSSAVVGAWHEATLPAPDVSCAFATPRSIQLTQEPYEAPVLTGPSPEAANAASARVVTLTF